MNVVPITKKGELDSRGELNQLTKHDRPRIIAAIAEARAHGDLKENAEYHAAREHQSLLVYKIQLMQSHAPFQIVGNSDIQTENVGFGNKVKILEEGMAIRASDIDIIWINGYGWPVYEGGPMFYGNLIGFEKILEWLKKMEEEYGADFTPSPYLEKVVKEKLNIFN